MTTVSVLIEYGADILQTDAKGVAVVYLSKKLAEANPIKYGNVHGIMRQNLRVNYNENHLKKNSLKSIQI